MHLPLFAQGLLFGLAIAAPVGPIGLLCIQRTLNQGRLAGLLSGLGAATADGFYGSVAAFGLSLVSDFLVAQQRWLQLVGGLFILFLGLRALRARPAETAASPTPARSLPGMFGSTFLLTLSNPVTILSFTAVFTGFGLAATATPLAAAALVAGVFLGSALWWLALSSGVSLLRHRIGPRALRWINAASGLILLAFGLALLLT